MEELSFLKSRFWNLWFMKIFRNFASIKFQLLILLYIPTIWGMFHCKPNTSEPWISDVAGLTFLGGGFATLAFGRIVAKTKLVENNSEFDTDK